MTTKYLGKEGLRWFIGKVEDIDDPEQLGRVRVRVFNEHTEAKLSVTDLHWATPIQPITSAGHEQVGRSPTGLLVGSIVFGFFLDGNEKQIPLIWGSYAKLPGKDQKNNDVPALAREINAIEKTQLGPEPKSAYNAKYPYNHVWQTLSGHAIEVDDTPSHERLHIYHKSGTYVEINNEGQRATKVVDNDIEVIVKDKTVYVKGDCNITVLGNVKLDVGGDVTASVGGNMDLSVDGNVTASASSWSITGDVSLDGKLTTTGDVVAGSISLDNHKHTDPQGGTTGKPI